jgi:hypothetical protein
MRRLFEMDAAPDTTTDVGEGDDEVTIITIDSDAED